MSVVPPVVDTPVTVPVVPDPEMVATDGDTLLHVPPDVTSDKVVVPPAQTNGTPVILDGSGFTVATAPTEPHEVV